MPQGNRNREMEVRWARLREIDGKIRALKEKKVTSIGESKAGGCIGILTFIVSGLVFAAVIEKHSTWYAAGAGLLTFLGIVAAFTGMDNTREQTHKRLVGRLMLELTEEHEEVERQIAEIEVAAADEADREHEAQERDRRRALRAELSERALQALESIPGHLSDAEAQLSRAEGRFAERAFIPYWTSIEKSAQALALVHQALKVIRTSAQHFRELEVPGNVAESNPPFPLTATAVKALSIGSSVTARLDAIVGRAHRDFEFSAIYEQRRTNQILIAGFRNLADALDGISEQIEGSIASLGEAVGQISSRVQAMNEDVGERLEAIHARSVDALNLQKSRAALTDSRWEEIRQRGAAAIRLLESMERNGNR